MISTSTGNPAALLTPTGIVAPSKSEPKPTPSFAQLADQVLRVRDYEVGGRISILPSIRAQKTGGEIDTDEATGVTDGRELLIREIARMRAQRMRVRVSCTQWRVADRSHVPETTLVEVRQVDQISS